MNIEPKRLAVLGRISALAATVALCATALARADTSGGISGFVVDHATHKTIPGAAVVVARLPEKSFAHRSLIADRKGFFVDLGLEPGRYAVTANVRGRTATCVIDDVNGGQVRRVKIELGGRYAGTCIGAYAVRTHVDPDETSSLYRVK
jgi:hypothetical protein